MKKLMLGIALAGSACGQQPQTIEAGPPPTPVTAPLHPLIGSEDNPTTTVPATTTTAPVTTRATHPPRATTTTELPSPQSRTVGRGNEPAGGDTPPGVREAVREQRKLPGGEPQRSLTGRSSSASRPGTPRQ